ncbi:CHRD domain-containing protein [Aquisphaera giovannonii]|uniref:CHRD domain-containing protein n=1 Tax=Aquisphaera giovannonii TaxID=406548 RepID=UPI0036F38D45
MKASTWYPAYVAGHGGTALGAEAALAEALAAGKAYLNVHTSQFPSREIRGFFFTVPERSSAVLGWTAALCVLGIASLRRVRTEA